jgi:wobble nucleotide-excising tRNase
MLKDANTSFEDADAKRESAQTTADLDTKELANIKETADITLLGNKRDIIGQIQGLQDEYNKAFHASGNAWIGKKYS